MKRVSIESYSIIRNYVD